MEVIEPIFKESAVKLSTLLLILATNICPGFITLYIFREDLILDLELIKTCILCCAVCFPIWLINFYFISRNIRNQETGFKNNKINLTVIVSSIVTLPVFYLPLIINFYYILSFRSVFQIVFITELVMIIYFILSLRKKKK